MDADATAPDTFPDGRAAGPPAAAPDPAGRPSRYTEAELDALVEQMVNQPIPASRLIGRDQFAADFPGLMAHAAAHPADRYAVYHGRTQVGFAPTDLAAIQLCRDNALVWQDCFICGIDTSFTYHESWPPAPDADRRP